MFPLFRCSLFRSPTVHVFFAGGYLSFMMQHGFLRHGVMGAFESFEHFRTNYEEVISLFRDDCDDSDDEKSYENDGSFNFRNLVRKKMKN